MIFGDDNMQAPASEAVWSPRRACTENKCHSGDKPCPCPQACFMPENTTMGWVLGLMDAIPVRHFWLGYTVLVLAVFAAWHLVSSV